MTQQHWLRLLKAAILLVCVAQVHASLCHAAGAGQKQPDMGRNTPVQAGAIMHHTPLDLVRW